MLEMPTATLDGRVVELRHVGFGVAMKAQKVAETTGDAVNSALVVLASSAHWQDSGERVFADVAAIEAWPMNQSMQIMELARLAGVVNDPRTPAERAGAAPSG